MVSIFNGQNVFEATLDRIRYVYNEFENVLCMMSGGKDSTVMYECCNIVARELKRKVDVLWLDQEAEWQGTVDYMKDVFRRNTVIPHWCQFPFDLDSSMSIGKPFFKVFEEGCEHIHPQEKDSILENPTKQIRFNDILRELPEKIMGTNKVAVLNGLRASENPIRRVVTMHNKHPYKNIGWSSHSPYRTFFYPIYDWTDKDVWTALGTFDWMYNRVYDEMFRQGYSMHDLRISALIHETAWKNLYALQEIEPKTYDKFIARIPDVVTYCQLNENIMSIRTLPDGFKNWYEYRNYLLNELVCDDVLRSRFERRWKKQDTDDWYKTHVKEILCDDYAGTLNKNHRNAMSVKRVRNERTCVNE